MISVFTFYRKRPSRHPQLALAGLFVLCLLLAFPTQLWAHPLGNFTVNRYSRLELATKEVHLLYIIDMAEIPTHQERTEMDGNGDGQISQQEQDQYLAAQVTAVQSNAHLTLNGAPVTWTAEASQLEFHDGQANLPILRLTVHYSAPLPAAAADIQAAYQDDNFIDRIGWSEVIVRANTNATLLKSTAPDKDLSNELRNYPTDLLQQPADVHAASFTFAPHASAQQNTTVGDAAGSTVNETANSSLALRKAASPFADRMAMPTLGPLAVLLALLAAFGYGAAHALTPVTAKPLWAPTWWGRVAPYATPSFWA